MKLFGKILPKYYSNIPAFIQIAKYIQKSKIISSGLFLQQGQELFLMSKEKKVYIDIDWQAYSMIRATAKLTLSTGNSPIHSGSCLRAEPDVFLSRQSYGNKHIDELYRIFQQNQKQKIMVFTKLLNRNEITKYIDQSIYDIVDLPQFSLLTELLTKLKHENNYPVIVQFGMNLMKDYYKQVNNGGNNEIDTLLISTYKGPFEKKLKSLPISIPLQQHYKLAWKSEIIPCKLTNQQKQGQLVFQIYNKK